MTKVKFKVAGQSGPLVNQFVRVTTNADPRVELIEGNVLNTDAEGNAVVDLQGMGVMGETAIIHGDTLPRDGYAAFKSFSGHAIIEDGLPIKTIAFGNSITANGAQSNRATLSDNYALIMRGWWVWADQLTKINTNMLDGRGVNGDTTTDLLARMDDVLLSGADVANLGVGTNDLGGNLEQARDNVIDMVDQMIATGITVIIRQVPYRDPADNLNGNADILNSYYKEIASTREKCFVSGDLTEFNNLVETDITKVLYDLLHPNNYGSYLLGKVHAETMDAVISSGYDDSTLIDINGDFNGDSGNVSSGANGVMPDGWVLFNADPTDGGASPAEGDGAVVALVDGKRELTLKTGSLQKPIDSRDAQLRTTVDVVVTPDDILSFEVRMSFDDISTAESLRICMLLQNGKEVSATFSNTLQDFQQYGLSDVLIRTGKIDVGTSTYVRCYVRLTSKIGSRTTIKLNSAKLKKFKK